MVVILDTSVVLQSFYDRLKDRVPLLAVKIS